MKNFFVVMWVRNVGAIGDWWLMSDVIDANDEREAAHKFIEKWSHMYETRGSRSITECKE